MADVTDVETWDRMLGWYWEERTRMLYLRDHNPALFPGFHDQTDAFDIVDPATAAQLAGPVIELSWLGITDDPGAAAAAG